MVDLEVSPRLTRWVRRNFAPASVGPVLTALRELPPQALGRQDSERIQAALVIGSRGRWESFLDMVGLVTTDWRDALVAADLADADWPARLDAALGS